MCSAGNFVCGCTKVRIPPVATIVRHKDLNPKVGGQGLPGITVEQQQQQQMAGCHLWDLTFHYIVTELK